MEILWLTTFVVGSGLAELGYWHWRKANQRRLDMSYVTYELTFPRNLKEEQAARVFEALSGLYGPMSKYGTFGRPTLVLELLGEPKGVHHLISFPANLAETVQGHLRAVIPAIGFEEVRTYPADWNYVIELQRPGRLVRKGEDTGAEVVWQESPGNSQLIGVLLGSLRRMEEGERALIQFVVTPIGTLEDSETPYRAVGRIAAVGPHDIRARQRIDQILTAYRSLGIFRARELPRQWKRRVNERAAPLTAWPIWFSPAGLATASAFPVGDPAHFPELAFGKGHKLVPEHVIPTGGEGTIRLAVSNYPGSSRFLAIPVIDTHRHTHVLGGNGVGKTTLLENIIVQAIWQGLGVTYIDPGGDSSEVILNCIPADRINDVVYIDLADPHMTVGYNPLDGEPYAVTSQVMAVFDKLYNIQSTIQTVRILRSSILTLALQGYTLLDVIPLLDVTPASQRFREHVVARVKDTGLKDFWMQYEAMQPGAKLQAVHPVFSRLSPFETYPTVRAALSQSKSAFNFKEMLAGNKITIVRIPQSLVGEEPSEIYGSLFTGGFYSAVQHRAGLKQAERTPHLFVIDEFQHFVNLPVSFSSVLAESRKWGLSFILAHQNYSQLTRSELREAVSTNAQNKIYFRVGDEDAARMARGMPGVTADDLLGLGNHEVLMRILVDGEPTNPATGNTLPPPAATGSASAVRRASALQYGRSVAEVEAEAQARRHVDVVKRAKPTIGLIVEPDDTGELE
jgi:hypothetical protein